jgi:hypothetical protein
MITNRNRRVVEDDARAFVVSANLSRRNLSKGQAAMALAMIYPEAGERGHVIR